MSVIYLMVPIALLLAGVAMLAFFWAVHRGQFEDLDTQRYRVLMDDDQEPAAADAVGERDDNGEDNDNDTPVKQ